MSVHPKRRRPSPPIAPRIAPPPPPPAAPQAIDLEALAREVRPHIDRAKRKAAQAAVDAYHAELVASGRLIPPGATRGKLRTLIRGEDGRITSAIEEDVLLVEKEPAT